MTFQSIQCLRGMAALMVVLHHALIDVAKIQSAEWLQAGVDIFFVISGFVMIVSTDTKYVSARDFLSARIARIVPLYWAALLVYLPVIALSGEIPPNGAEIFQSFLFIFYSDSRTGQPMPFLLSGWTLNYEMYFYLLFAALIRFPVIVRLGLLACFFIAMVGLRKFVPNPEDGLAFRLTSPLPLEFVAGMALACSRHILRLIGPIFGILLMTAGLGLLIFLSRSEPRIIYYGLPATLIVAGAVIAEPFFARPMFNPAIAVGNISYSLYLSHGVVLRLLSVVGLTAFWTGATGVLIAVMLCLGVAFPIYKYVEQPLFRMARSMLGRARPVRIATQE